MKPETIISHVLLECHRAFKPNVLSERDAIEEKEAQMAEQKKHNKFNKL